MADNVIDLLSSDDEEQGVDTCRVAEQKADNASCLMKKPAPLTETIDLCDSGSDNDAAALCHTKIATRRPAKKKQGPSSSFLSISMHWNDEDDDDDDLLNMEPVFRKSAGARMERASLPASSQVSSAMQAHRSSLSQSPTIPSSANKVTPSLSATNAAPFAADSDDEILNFTSGLTRKRISTPAAKSNTVSNPYASSSTLAVARSTFATKVAVNPYARSGDTSTPTAAPTSCEPRIVVNPYDKSHSATTQAPNQQTAAPFPYPKLTEHAKEYPDVRARFLWAFWKYGKSLVSHSRHIAKLDITAKRVVKLALAKYPIRSVEELALGGNSHWSVSAFKKSRDELLEDLNLGRLNDTKTPTLNGLRQHYHSIVEACLVVLLENAERSLFGSAESLPKDLSEKKFWMPLQDMIPAIDQRLWPRCPGRLTRRGDSDNGAAHYVDKDTRSMEFLQIKKLECSNGDEGPYVKRRSFNRQVHYELLPEGFEIAKMIQSRCFPAPPGHQRSSKILSLQDVDKRYENICLGVDSREGGGQSKTLHQMCNKLEMMKCPYFVGTFTIGDYVFFTTKKGSLDQMNHLCPILVERKSIQDVAQSIHDGRWRNQKNRMYAGQYVFGYDKCRMVYIIEGNENKHTVSGGYIGAHWFGVSKDTLDAEIKNLEEEGFDVLRTTSVENSMFELARWVQRIAAEMNAGKIEAEFTYAEFKQKVAEIRKGTDFSRLAKFHKKERDEVARSSSSRKNSRPSPEMPVAKKHKSIIEDDDPYAGWSKKDLEKECEKVGLPKSAKTADEILSVLARK